MGVVKFHSESVLIERYGRMRCLFIRTQSHAYNHPPTHPNNQPKHFSSTHLFVYALVCEASVSVWFRSKERPRNGIFGFSRSRSLFQNRTKTLATQFIRFKRERDWSQSESCKYFWDRYWGCAGQLLAYFPLMFLVTVPEFIAKFNSAQFPSRMGQFESASEIDLVVVVPNCTMGLLLLHDAAILALTVYLLFSDSAGLPT